MHENNAAATLPNTTHHYTEVNGTTLHHVAAGDSGSPVLLVHGFPETWWTFHKVLPLLAAQHRVFAVDLRGFGESANAPGDYSSSTHAEDLHALLDTLDVGPVHLTGQDISGASVFRLASNHPEALLSLTAIEMGLAGYGLEALADVTSGGTWHIGMLIAPGISDMLLTGREQQFLGDFAFPAMSANPDAFAESDIEEFVRTYSRPDGWRGATGLYQAMLREGTELQELVRTAPLALPTLAVDAGGAPLTSQTMSAVSGNLRTAALTGVGHYPAMESPQALAAHLLSFFAGVDAGSN